MAGQPELKPLFPRPQADGRHDVAAWARFMVEHNLARAAEDVETEPDPRDDTVINPPPIGGSSRTGTRRGVMSFSSRSGSGWNS